MPFFVIPFLCFLKLSEEQITEPSSSIFYFQEKKKKEEEEIGT
jgi:hypothetical protein